MGGNASTDGAKRRVGVATKGAGTIGGNEGNGCGGIPSGVTRGATCCGTGTNGADGLGTGITGGALTIGNAGTGTTGAGRGLRGAATSGELALMMGATTGAFMNLL